MSTEVLPLVQGGAAVAGLLVLLLAETLRPFFPLFDGRLRRRARHAGRNVALGFVNAMLVAGLFASAWVATATWAEREGVGLLHVLRDHAGLPVWGHAALAILLFDAWTYAWHRLNHRVPLLWRFHRVHHADAEMDVTTASRFHTGEIVLSSLLRVPLIGALGIYAWELVLYETAMFAVVQFHHANVALPERLDRVLRTVIVTPAMHKVHHSRWQPETDSNYSSLFSWWDRLFGSFRHRRALGQIRFGLDAYDAEEHTTLRGLAVMPFEDPPEQAAG